MSLLIFFCGKLSLQFQGYTLPKRIQLSGKRIDRAGGLVQVRVGGLSSAFVSVLQSLNSRPTFPGQVCLSSKPVQHIRRQI